MKRILSIIVTLIMTVSIFPYSTFAEPNNVSSVHINPIYRDVISDTELAGFVGDRIEGIQRINPYARSGVNYTGYCSTVEEAGTLLKEQLKQRKTEAAVKLVMTNGSDQAIKQAMSDIFDAALVHTGVPTEGDYIKFVWEAWECSAGGYTDGTKYYLTFNYTISYYTDSQQEAELDAAIAKLKSQLDISYKTDYEKIKAIYDYMTENITYDENNLNDDSYKLKYTAYAALVNKTAVCQGYAVLLYRLALEYGIDARVISGVSSGESHGWNIIKINDKYYYADATWDAGEEKYDYFLKGSSDFKDHTSDDEYLTAEFKKTYNISSANYEGLKEDVVIGEEKEITVYFRENSLVTAEIVDQDIAKCKITGSSWSTSSEGHLYGRVIEITPSKIGTTKLIIKSNGNIVNEYIINVIPKETTVDSHVGYNSIITYESLHDEVISYNYVQYLEVKILSKTKKTSTTTVNGVSNTITKYVYEIEVGYKKPGKFTYSLFGETSGEFIKASASITDHDWGAVETLNATCEEPGEKKRVCEICEYEDVLETYDPLGHDYIKTVVTQTCVASGYTSYKCDLCGDEYFENVQPATGHTEEIDKSVDPTCTEPGLSQGSHCQKCGTSIVKQVSVPALGHSYNEGVVLKEATEKTEGEIKYTCTECGDEYTEKIPALKPKGVFRIFGNGRIDTSIKAADQLKVELGVDKFENVVVATAYNFADALPGSYVAAQKNAPILLIDGDGGYDKIISKYINDNMDPNGTVYILGGEGVVPSEWLATVEVDDDQIVRLGGANRYGTNLEILKAIPVENTDTVMVCTGMNFADSLSASATGNPILLADDGLTAEQIEYLESIKGKCDFCMIGGTGAVPPAIANAIAEYDKDGEVDRAAGASRFETSIAVAEKFVSSKNPTDAVLAYGYNFPDGLSGGPVAYAMGAPLLLTASDSKAEYTLAKNYIADEGIKNGYILGGTALISDPVVITIFGLGKYVEIPVL